MSLTPDQTALLAACRQLLQPLARFALSRGLSYHLLDELLRQALVGEAQRMHGASPAHGQVSRISTATGLSRREVSRLIDASGDEPAAQRWLAGEVFTRWMTDPDYQQDGKPRALPRQGGAPSFESLAQSITRDVHPRSLLDELCRLELADWRADDDQVSLRRDAFVPRADFSRMLALLADNVGDHLHAAVDNVLGQGNEHFEQAIYADELSPQSVQALRPLIAAQWTALIGNLVPALEKLITDDAATGRTQDQRVRIGFYSFSADAPSAVTPTAAPDASPSGPAERSPPSARRGNR